MLRLFKLFRILRASRIFARWEAQITIPYADRELIRWMTLVFTLLHWLACVMGLMAQLNPGQRTPQLQEQVVQRIDEGGDDLYYKYGRLGDTCYGCVVGDSGLQKYCESTCLSPCEIDLLAHAQLQAQHEALGKPGFADPFAYELHHARQLVYKAETWICRYNQLGVVSLPKHTSEVWVASLYVAMIMLSGGVGSIYPENVGEYIVFIIGMFIGSVIWAMVVGTVCAIMATGDPHLHEYHQHMDRLNAFLAEAAVPQEIGVQARTYLRATQELRKKLSYDELISHLSPGLRGEIMLYLSKSTFSHVWYLASVEGECLVQLAARLARHGFPPRERMASTQLNILMRGIAARGGDLLYGGMCWGSDMILTSPVLRDTRLITALTYVEVQALSRDSLYEVLEMYPESAKMVQNAAVRMALKRTVLLLKAYADSQNVGAEKDGSGGLSASGSAAYNMLTAAFQPNADANTVSDASNDPAQIFRIITGSKLRDLDDDGNLIEQVETSPNQRYAMSEQEERRTMRRQIDALSIDVVSVKSGMREMDAMLRELTGRPPLQKSPDPNVRKSRVERSSHELQPSPSAAGPAGP